MSTIRAGGVIFRLYPNDHEPCHVHAEYGQTAAIIDLRLDRVLTLAQRPDAVRPANAKRGDVKKILEAARENFDALMVAWEAMHQ